VESGGRLGARFPRRLKSQESAWQAIASQQAWRTGRLVTCVPDYEPIRLHLKVEPHLLFQFAVESISPNIEEQFAPEL
jgi:hypothetical protein